MTRKSQIPRELALSLTPPIDANRSEQAGLFWRHRFVTSPWKTQLTFQHATSFLLGLAFLWIGQPFAIAQQDGTGLAQGNFRAVKKTTASPFELPADPAVPNVKTIGTNLKAFGVPFKINADNDSFVEVQLYMSRDMGQTWTFHSRQKTDRNDFPFRAEQDGEYWFSLKTLDRDRRLLPDGDPQPELKIVVDTVKPTVDFRVQTDAAGRVVCRWNAQDKNLSPDSFRIFYQPMGDAGATTDWQAVPVQLNGTARVGVYADQIAWWPETTDRQLNVAIEIRDIAGNTAQAQRQVVVPQSTWRHRSESLAQITDSNRAPLPDQAIATNQFSPPTRGGMESQAESNSANSNSGTAPEKNVNHSTHRPNPDHPSNVVCENGVCRVIPAQLIGSEAELAEPPSPDQFTQSTPRPTKELAKDTVASRPGSVVWQSDPQARISSSRSSIGTTIGATLRPDPALAPQTNPMQTAAKPVTDVPSNPPTMKNVGDQVIGESSTMGSSNQYRGLNSQAGSTLPPPSLLPDAAANQMNSMIAGSTPNKYPNTGHTGFASATSHNNDHSGAGKSVQNGAGRSIQPAASRAGVFSNAGYPNRVVANPFSQTTDQAPESVVERLSQTPKTESSAATQIIGTKRFRLDYGIDAIDPSGVARVDLWTTLDGINWNAWGSDPNNQSPFPVEVQNDGRYGFRIVVHSKDGLTGQGPSSGDDADIWILIDTQSPLTQISSVPYGRGEEAGRLVINYSVTDDQLTLRPITLAYAASPQGPWTLIGEGLRNESRYVWKPGVQVPEQIYLRIDALDKAGNVGIHVLNQAIDVSGLVPRGTIRGVSPVGR